MMGLTVIIFLLEPCKMKTAHPVGAILVKCRKLRSFGVVCGSRAPFEIVMLHFCLGDN